jgi:hypothetical protein
MADRDFELDVLGDLQEQATTIGQLARAEKSFLAAFEAFRSQDKKAFQAALRRPRLLGHCRLVCEWIRIKECMFVCLRLCGPPRPIRRAPNPRVLAEAIVRVTSDEKAVRELVQAVEKGDRAAFQRVVRAYKLGPLCHFFCHWVCYVRFRLVCRWMCEPDLVEPPDLGLELRAAGHALRVLLEDRKAWDSAVAASDAGDAEKLRRVVETAELIPLCRYICFFFCSWRCVLVCSTLCIRFPIATIEDPLREALDFAKATRALAERPRELERLSAAVGAGDAEAFTAIVEELHLQRFCTQLCHWICFLRCRRFCFPVCPPVGLYPWFTSIGGYEYLTDVDSTPPGTGLTVDNRAFYSTMRLNGILTQTLGGQPLEYRFEVRTTNASGNPVPGPTGTWRPVKPAQIAKTDIGKWQRWNPITLTMETKTYVVGGPPGPNELAATIDADGWVKVPQENNFLSLQGAFFPNGNMIRLVSPSIGDVFSPPSNPFPHQNEAATVAGGAPAHPLAQDKHFGIRMRVRQVGNPGSETNGGTCEHAAIDNILYDNIVRHPNWDGGPLPPDQLAVAMLNIQELLAVGCARITNSLTVLFTAGHPNLGAVTIEMTGPGGPYAFALPASGTGEWFGTATPSGWSVASLTPCAYIVTLSVGVLLTTGDSVPLPLQDQIAFCKS